MGTKYLPIKNDNTGIIPAIIKPFIPNKLTALKDAIATNTTIIDRAKSQRGLLFNFDLQLLHLHLKAINKLNTAPLPREALQLGHFFVI